MSRVLVAVAWLGGLAAWAQGTEASSQDVVPEAAQAADAGTGDAPPAPPAPKEVPIAAAPPAPPSESPGPFDLVQSLWGPGRKSSGEKFSSAATPLEPGPFRLTGEKWSLGFGGQYFARGELRDNRDYNGAVGDHELGFEHRARLSVRASAFGRVGVLVEFQDVRFWGSEPNTATTTPNTGLHQGFVDVKVAEWLDVRVGRQELSYGEDRLIGNLDWAQSARAFDGVFLRLEPSDTTTVDGFAMMLRPPAWLADATGRLHNSGQYFYGLYARLRPSKTLGVDGYALGLHNDAGTLATGPGPDTNLATLGARVSSTWGALALVGEGAFQTGQQGAALVLAGAFAGRGTYTFTAPGKWYVGAEVLGASGDGDTTDTTQRTFNQLFPTGHAHLGFMDYVGWQNVLGFKGSVGFRPYGAHVWLDVHHFRFWDPRGASYNAAGAQLLAADATRTNANLGTELDFNVTVPVTKYAGVSGAFAVFLPGGGSSARGSSPSTWGFLSVRSQF
ncbi:MAG: alginate export family protein [Myxococcales bacterium]|nr:alginate export family protein [Myxococcales bacterium]